MLYGRDAGCIHGLQLTRPQTLSGNYNQLYGLFTPQVSGRGGLKLHSITISRVVFEQCPPQVTTISEFQDDTHVCSSKQFRKPSATVLDTGDLTCISVFALAQMLVVGGQALACMRLWCSAVLQAPHLSIVRQTSACGVQGSNRKGVLTPTSKSVSRAPASRPRDNWYKQSSVSWPTVLQHPDSLGLREVWLVA